MTMAGNSRARRTIPCLIASHRLLNQWTPWNRRCTPMNADAGRFGFSQGPRRSQRKNEKRDRKTLREGLPWRSWRLGESKIISVYLRLSAVSKRLIRRNHRGTQRNAEIKEHKTRLLAINRYNMFGRSRNRSALFFEGDRVCVP